MLTSSKKKTNSKSPVLTILFYNIMITWIDPVLNGKIPRVAILFRFPCFIASFNASGELLLQGAPRNPAATNDVYAATANASLSLAFLNLTRYRWYHAEQKPYLYHARRSCFAPNNTKHQQVTIILRFKRKYGLGGGAGYRPRVRNVYFERRLSP